MLPNNLFHQRIAGRYWIESALSSGEPSVLEIGEPAMTGNQTHRCGNSGQIVAPTMFGSLFVRHETHFRQHPEFEEIFKARTADLNRSRHHRSPPADRFGCRQALQAGPVNETGLRTEGYGHGNLAGGRLSR